MTLRILGRDTRNPNEFILGLNAVEFRLEVIICDLQSVCARLSRRTFVLPVRLDRWRKQAFVRLQ